MIHHDDDLLLDRSEAAEYTGFAHGTLEVWASERKNLSYLKLGKKAYYRKSELDRFLKTRTVEAA